MPEARYNLRGFRPSYFTNLDETYDSETSEEREVRLVQYSQRALTGEPLFQPVIDQGRD